jgi:hypothetical protein
MRKAPRDVRMREDPREDGRPQAGRRAGTQGGRGISRASGHRKHAVKAPTTRTIMDDASARLVEVGQPREHLRNDGARLFLW